MIDHVEIVHKGLGSLQCPKCERTYRKRDSYNKHMRLHEGEVFNICEICGKNSMSKSDLAKHIRRHLGDKKYKSIFFYCNKISFFVFILDINVQFVVNYL